MSLVLLQLVLGDAPGIGYQATAVYAPQRLLSVGASSFFPNVSRTKYLRWPGVLALAGHIASRSGLRITPLYLPYHILVITGAGIRGLVAFFRDTDASYWEPRK